MITIYIYEIDICIVFFLSKTTQANQAIWETKKQQGEYRAICLWKANICKVPPPANFKPIPYPIYLKTFQCYTHLLDSEHLDHLQYCEKVSPKAEEGEDKEKQHLKFSVGKNLKCELSGRPLDTERRMLLMGWRAWWELGERRVNTSQYPGFPNLTCKYIICTHWGTKKSSKIQGRWVRCDINSLPTLWGVPETHKLPTDS